MIKNLKIKHYFDGRDTFEMDAILPCVNEKNEFIGKVADYSKLTFDEVETIKNILRNPNLEKIKEVFCLLYDISERKFF